MAKNTKGASNLTYLFALKTDHTAIEGFAADGKPSGTAITALTDGYLLDQNYSGQHTYQNGGKDIQITLDQDMQTELLEKIFDLYKSGAAGADAVKYENGSTAPSPTAAAAGGETYDLLVVRFGGLTTDTVSKRIVWAAVMNFSEDSGSHTTNDTDTTKPTAILTSKKPLIDITLPAAVFNSVPGTGVTAPVGEKLLAADSKSYKKFILAVAP
jgi:hypothetical protein